MKAISLGDPDGKGPAPTCRSAREALVQTYQVPALIVRRYFAGGGFSGFPTQGENKAPLEHVRDCPNCRAWIPSIVDAKMLRRQERQSHYCCGPMFCAVEEPRRSGRPRFQFYMHRGEDPDWSIAGKGGGAYFCPWCGKAHPDHPFIQDD
jgi:hypothetical protein